MTNQLKYFCVLVLGSLLTLAGCEKKEIIFQGPYHVRFTEPTGSARESNTKPIEISIHLAGPQLSEDITVRYAISGNAREGIDYEIEGTRGEVEIPAGESFAYITLKLINNANNILESQDIIFTILETSPDNLKIGRSEDGIIGRKMTFTIIDDCILSGSYTGRREGKPIAIPEINITSVDCKEYYVSSWNIGLSIYPTIPFGFNFIDNGDNTLRIPAQLNNLMSFDEFFDYNPRIKLVNDTLRGIGSINPLNGRMSFTLEVKAKAATGPDTITTFPVTFPITYTPER